MKIAVALLTCDRYDYTVRTVESLLEHNDTSDWLLFHADDASTDERVVPYVQAQGFETIVQNATRLGCSPTTERLIHAVAKRVPPETPLLYLQNDFESSRPILLDLCGALLAREDCGFLQLAYRRPRSKHSRRLRWTLPDGEPWVFGDASRSTYVHSQPAGCGYHPTLCRLQYWLDSVAGVKKERQFVRSNARLGKRIYRLTVPPMRHIGRSPTPGGLFGVRREHNKTRIGRDNYQPPTTFVRTGWHASPTLCAEIARYARPGMRTLECGSGVSTWVFVALGCDHTALEHDSRFAPDLPEVQVCPLVGDPAWYDWQPDGPYDVIVIDGPPSRKPGRHGFLRIADRVIGPETVVILDDTDRPQERELADRIAERFGRRQRNIPPQCDLDYRRLRRSRRRRDKRWITVLE